MSKSIMSRRNVLQAGAAAGAGLALPTILTAGSHSGYLNAPTGSTVTLGFNVPQSGPYADEGADEDDRQRLHRRRQLDRHGAHPGAPGVELFLHRP